MKEKANVIKWGCSHETAEARNKAPNSVRLYSMASLYLEASIPVDQKNRILKYFQFVSSIIFYISLNFLFNLLLQHSTDFWPVFYISCNLKCLSHYEGHAQVGFEIFWLLITSEVVRFKELFEILLHFIGYFSYTGCINTLLAGLSC